MKEPVTGVQLYTLRDFTKTAPALDETLRRLKEMGVGDVQISAIGADIPTASVAALLQKHGMRVCVTHQSFDRLQNDLPAVIEFHKAIGCSAVGLGYTPEQCRDSEAHAGDFVASLQSIAEALREHGMGLHYHNHDFEFQPLPRSEKTLMDLLLAADETLLSFIPDVAWLKVAGQDPAAFLRRVQGRVKVVHFKDYVPRENGRPRFVSLGQGCVELAALFALCRDLEIPYIMYEQDDSWEQDDPFAATKTSLSCFETLHRNEL